ncbi:MAG: cation-efflux pump [Chloroflexi bacterium]|nr:cation-efflux pump [Chloroflexota bacterium]
MSDVGMEQQVREKGNAAVTSVIAAIFLTSMKLVVGIMTGSLGILAEAAHSALDLVAALITFFAVRVSDRPADETHLYGHGKVENLSALAETALLLITCGWIIYEAINRLFFETVEVDPSIWAFVTMGISIIVDVSRSRVLARAAKKYNSQALEADALHFSTDVWSSSVVIVGLALVWIGDAIGQKSILVRADAVAAFLVALIVTFVSYRLGRRTIDALLDRAPEGMAEQIASAVQQVEHVRGVLRARVRGSGNQIFVDLRIAVPRHLSFEESHAVTNQVQDAVRSIAPAADIVITPVPVAEDEGVLERIQAVAERGHFDVHNITTHLTKRGVWIDLDLEVPPAVSFEDAHAMATDLENRLRAEFKARPPKNDDQAKELTRVADINVHIEPVAEELVAGAELSSSEKAKFAERINVIRSEISHTRAIQDIDVQRLNGSVYLAFHLVIDAQLSIAQVHSIAEEMENRLRREFPQLGRVMIHAEPYKK